MHFLVLSFLTLLVGVHSATINEVRDAGRLVPPAAETVVKATAVKELPGQLATANVKLANVSPNTTPASLKQAPHIVMLGPPGVGKGTYAGMLKESLNVPHISTGDMIRAAISEGSDIGKEFKSYSDQGLLVPDEVVCKIVEKRLNERDVANGYILDGFPRTVPQAQQLQRLANPPNLVLNLHLPDHILTSKLSGRRVCKGCGRSYNVNTVKDNDYVMPPLFPKVAGRCDDCNAEVIQRVDDSEETVKKRLEVYKNETSPLIDFYRNVQVGGRSLLKTIEPKKGVRDYPKMLAVVQEEMAKQKVVAA